jgi:hypothetical protein
MLVIKYVPIRTQEVNDFERDRNVSEKMDEGTDEDGVLI